MNTNVYIATLPRSGSTLLGMMLNNHSRMFHVGESSYWGKLNPVDVVCSCGISDCAVLREVGFRIAQSSAVKAIYAACIKIDRQEEPDKVCHPLSLPGNDDVTAVSNSEIEQDLSFGCLGLEQIADVFRDLSGKDVIIDNTKNIRFAKFLISRRWRIILMMRDPRGIVNSNKNAGFRKGVLRPVIAKIPVLINFAIQAFSLLESPQVILVKYEDLCARPAIELTRVCDFLGVDYETSMLNFRADKGHTIMGNRMRFDESSIVAVDNSWSKQLSQEETALVVSNTQLTALYSRFGYELKGE